MGGGHSRYRAQCVLRSQHAKITTLQQCTNSGQNDWANLISLIRCHIQYLPPKQDMNRVKSHSYFGVSRSSITFESKDLPRQSQESVKTTTFCVSPATGHCLYHPLLNTLVGSLSLSSTLFSGWVAPPTKDHVFSSLLYHIYVCLKMNCKELLRGK